MGRRRCCCFGPCAVFSDPFDREDNTDLGSGWDERNGVTAIVNEELEQGGGGLVIATTSTATEEQSVSGRITTYATGDVFDIVCNYLDDANYFFARHIQGATNATVRLYRRAGGIDTPLTPALTTPKYEEGIDGVGVCFSKESFTWVGPFAVPLFDYSCNPSIHSGGKKAGLGNGGSSTIGWDDFVLANYHGEDGPAATVCCLQQCKCGEQCIPQELTLTLEATGACAGMDGWSTAIVYNHETEEWESQVASEPPCAIPTFFWRFGCARPVCGVASTPGKLFILSNDEDEKGGGCGTSTSDCMPITQLSPTFNEESAQCSPLIVVFPWQTWLGTPEPEPPGECQCCNPRKNGAWRAIVTA